MSSSSFKIIIDNYLSNMYLSIYAIVKSKTIALEIIYNTFDHLFTIDYYEGPLLKVRDKIDKYIDVLVKKALNNPTIDKDYDLNDVQIPSKLYDLDFKINILFSDIDNMIFVLLFIYSYSINDVTVAIKRDEKYILERYKQIIRYIRTQYLENIRKLD